MEGSTLPEPKYSAAAYEVVIARRGKPSETLPLDNFDGAGSSFLRYFASYVNSIPTTHLVRDHARSFGSPSEIKMAGATYSCRLISGTSGIVSKFRGPDGKWAFERDGDDVEEIDFGLYVLEPPNAKVGFLVTEFIGGRTICQSFRTFLVNHFKSIYPDALVTLSRTAQTDAWREAEKQGTGIAVKQITAVHRGIEASAMQNFGIGAGRKVVGEYRQILNFKEEPQSANVLKKVRASLWPTDGLITATRGTISFVNGDDGGPEDETDSDISELIAEVIYPGGTSQSIRCSGARPPRISYPIEPISSETPEDAFRRSARQIAKNLADDTDCKLEQGWDTGEWKDAKTLPKWEVNGFGAADPPP